MVGFALVEQAVGEAVLAIEVGLSADVAEDGQGDNPVLMVAQQLLEVFRRLDDLACGLSQGGSGDLRGVSKPFGGFVWNSPVGPSSSISAIVTATAAPPAGSPAPGVGSPPLSSVARWPRLTAVTFTPASRSSLA